MKTRTGCVTLFAAALLVAQPQPSYHVTHTYSLGGGGSWDYVVPDPSNHRLFIARQNRVMVVDEDRERCWARSPASMEHTAPRSQALQAMALQPQGMIRP